MFNVLKHKDHAFIQNMVYIIYLYYILNFKKIQIKKTKQKTNKKQPKNPNKQTIKKNN